MTPQNEIRNIYTNFWITWKISKYNGQISHFIHNYTRRHRCVISDWTGSMRLWCRIFGKGSIPSKCAQELLNGQINVNCNIKCFFMLLLQKHKWGGCFVTGRDVINSMENIRRNGPSTSNYTSMHRQYNCCWNWNYTIKQQQSCSSPGWDNLPCGHQRYPLLGIN